MGYAVLADLVLGLHVTVVLFVVGGLLVLPAGHRFGWRWTSAPAFRVAHLAAIAVVALQAWLGRVCPLTTLEMALRERAGEATYAGDFVAHWLQRLLYWDAPPWAFTLAYTVFGLLVAAAWWRYPPRRRLSRSRS